MLWFTVWAVLVAGALVVAFLVGRRVWRALVALGEEVGRAGDVAQRLADRTAQLEQEARAAQERVRPALGGDAKLVRARVEQLRAERRERSVARRARHRVTVAAATTRWFG